MSGSISASTLAAVAIATTAIGTGVSIMGQMQAGDAAKAQASYQAGVARNNAILAQRAATDARSRGDQLAATQAMKTRELIGKQRAVLANNGGDVNSGSALDLTSDTAAQGALDELTTRDNANRQALNFEAQGSNFNASAQLDELKGANAQSAALTGAVGSGLSGIGSVASKWYEYDRKGAFA